MPRGVPVSHHMGHLPHEQPWHARAIELKATGLLEPYINEYTQQIIQDNRLQTAYYYRRELVAFSEAYPDKAPEDVTSRDLVQYTLARGEGKAPSTKAKTVSVLRGFFLWLTTLQVIDRNPASVLKRPRVAPPPPRFLEPAQVNKLIKTAAKHDPTMEVFCALGAYAGLRKGSILALKWEDVDLTANIIRVNHAKGDKHAILPVHQQLQKVLLKARARRSPQPQYYVVSDDAHPLAYSSANKRFKKLLRLAALPGDIGAHDLRRSFATQLHRQKVDIAVISRLMTHATIDTTLNHYAFTDDRMKREAINQLGY